MDKFLKELKLLMKKHGVEYIGVDLDGDTHCLDENVVVKIKGKEKIVEHHTAYLYESDL